MSITKQLTLLAISVCFAACAPTRDTVAERTAVTMSLKDVKVTSTPIVADLDIKQSRVASSDKWTLLQRSSESIDRRKQNLMARILEQNNADVLLDPKVVVKKKWIGTTKISMTGYPANYKNIRTSTKEDLQRLAQGGDIKEKQMMALHESDMQPSTDLSASNHPLPRHTWRILAGGTLSKHCHTIGKANGQPFGGGNAAADYRLRLGGGRWYYGALLGIDTHCQGAQLAASNLLAPNKFFSCDLMCVPLRLGRSCYINQDNSFYLHAGVALDWVFLAKEEQQDTHFGPEYLHETKGLGAGLELVLGWQWKRFSIEFAPRFLFQSPLGRFIGNTTNMNLRLGFAF